MQTCNFIPCEALANFGILSDGNGPDLETHACTEHVGKLLEPGHSTVWPLADAVKCQPPHHSVACFTGELPGECEGYDSADM